MTLRRILRHTALLRYTGANSAVGITGNTSYASVRSTRGFYSLTNRFATKRGNQTESGSLFTHSNRNPPNKLGEQKRFLNLHEYQSKQILKQYGLNVQKGSEASTPEEAYEIAKALKAQGAEDLILKAQVLAGGRGKGALTSGLQGGVKICKTPEEVLNYAKQMIGYNLITHQTTESGEKVNKVLVHQGVSIDKELYVAIVLDRKLNGPAIITSTKGGMDIEEVSETDPKAISVSPINIKTGITQEQAFQITEQLGFETDHKTYPMNIVDQIQKLYQMFVECDCSQIEINPFAVVDNGDAVCVDAKLQFDDSAKHRHKELFAMEDKSTLDPRELAAEKIGVVFVPLDGNIACLVNGAGLGMATLDIISLHGGKPANFLDGGGTITANQVTECFKVLHMDTRVKAIFINIFGGIVFCDTIANGIVEAAKNIPNMLPLVVRLCGNRVPEGQEILKKSGINCSVHEDLEEAAIKVCSYVKQD